MTFTEADYDTLAALVFRPDYPGYRPTVVEAPDGDPGARDSGKRYAHVATKYLLWPDAEGAPDMTPDEFKLYRYLQRAHTLAMERTVALNVEYAFWPAFSRGALRVLEYPAGVGASHVHTDPDLFTVNLWRSCPNPGLGGDPYHIGRLGTLVGLGPAQEHHVEPLPVVQRSLVYFAIPDHAERLPGGMLVGDWLDIQMKNMRHERMTP